MNQTSRESGVFSFTTNTNTESQNNNNSHQKYLTLQDLNSERLNFQEDYNQKPQTCRKNKQQPQDAVSPKQLVKTNNTGRERSKTSQNSYWLSQNTVQTIESKKEQQIQKKDLCLALEKIQKKEFSKRNSISPKDQQVLRSLTTYNNNTFSNVSPRFNNENIDPQQYQNLDFYEKKIKAYQNNEFQMQEEIKNLHQITKEQQLEIQRLKNTDSKKAWDKQIQNLQRERQIFQYDINRLNQEHENLISLLQKQQKELDNYQNNQLEVELIKITQKQSKEDIISYIKNQDNENKKNLQFNALLTDLVQKCGQFEQLPNIKQIWKFIKRIFEEYAQLKGRRDEGEKEILHLTKQYLNIQYNKEIIPSIYSLQEENKVLINLFKDVKKKDGIDEIKSIISNASRYIVV